MAPFNRLKKNGVSKFDSALLLEYGPAIISGTLKTIQIASLSCLIGITGGTLLAIVQVYAPPFIRWPLLCVMGIIKGTPMLVQITFAFYLLPQIGIVMPAFWTAVCAIGLNSSVYLSSTICAGILAVPQGQVEAAYVLGFSRVQIMRYIVLPQAFLMIFPALGNEFITLVKDSSLASIIGVMELAKEASIMRSRTYDVITSYTIIACVYIVLTGSIAAILFLIKRRMSRA
jgi:polar amino acid transport system permease protein